MKIYMNNKSQITIFIILGLIIIVGIAILYLLIKPPIAKVIDENNPQAFIESCTKDATETALNILMNQGGDIEPKGYITYDKDDVAYLCYILEYYKPCINQRPLLIEHIEKEITGYIEPLVNNCFIELEKNLEKRYEIKTSSMKLKTTLQPKYIVIDIDKRFEMTRGEENLKFDYFKVVILHPIYDLAEIAMEIANQESKYCNFDELGFMIIYPNYDITKFITGDGDVIYNIKDKPTNQKFKLAIRSCPLPPGY